MDAKLVENVLEALNQTDAHYFKIENSTTKIEILRSSMKAQPLLPVSQPSVEKLLESTEEEVVDNTYDITSPYIGFFQRSETKGAKPIVKLREVVDEGKVVAYILSMNLQYEVTSTQKGKIVDVLVEDGQAVEYGQPLYRLKLNQE